MENYSQRSQLNVLHITGRSDHGGGPEHIFQLISTQSVSIKHAVACPRNGIYWDRYQSILGREGLCSISYRSFTIFSLVRLAIFISTNKIEIIHSHGTAAGIFSRILGAFLRLPVVHTFHGTTTIRNCRSTLLWLLEYIQKPFTEAAIAVSKGEALLISQKWPGYSNRIYTVPNGIDFNLRSSPWTDWPINKPVLLVSFSRNNRQKNPWLVLEIARLLEKQKILFHLNVYGEGLDHSDFKFFIEKHRLEGKIKLHPPTDNPEQALNGENIYISTSRWEGMPLAILEAWRSGLIVIASDVIGNRDLIDHDITGRLYGSENPSEAAQCIIDLLLQPVLAENIRERALAKGVTYFDKKTMVQSLILIYHGVLENR